MARERGDAGVARELLAAAHEWAMARDAKEPLCWAAVVRARIALTELSVLTSRVGEDVSQRALQAARAAIEDGLRIARDCGYGIYHIDLLLLRAQVALYEGHAVAAERAVRAALEEGVRPAADSGLPTLLAAADPECDYAWGEAAGRQLLAEAKLLQAAQILGSNTYDPRSPKTPTEVRELIELAQSQLQQCIRLRKRIQDPALAVTGALLAALKRGELSRYWVVPPKETSSQPETGTMRDQVFISYSHKDKDWLEKLETTLRPLVRTKVVTLWADTRIRAGKKWKEEIEDALERAKVAVLLVSRSFLASDFIASKEIPPILEAAENDGLTIIWVPITASLFEETEFAQYQAAHDPRAPLNSLSEADVDQALVDICKQIKTAVNP